MLNILQNHITPVICKGSLFRSRLAHCSYQFISSPNCYGRQNI